MEENTHKRRLYNDVEALADNKKPNQIEFWLGFFMAAILRGVQCLDECTPFSPRFLLEREPILSETARNAVHRTNVWNDGFCPREEDVEPPPVLRY